MLMDTATKDVFREMDGFLVLMSFLSTSAFSSSESPATAFDLVMQVFSTAMIDHPINQTHFKVSFILVFPHTTHSISFSTTLDIARSKARLLII